MRYIGYWDYGYYYVYSPEDPNVIGKGYDDKSALGDLMIKKGAVVSERDEYKPVGSLQIERSVKN